jgi:hypothetical protein
VKDVPLAELRTNTVVLARLAKLANIPLITTASVPDGPNGPLMHELQEVAPDATYVPRKGEISAWDYEDFVTDASGDPSPMASQRTVARLTQAGIIPMSTCAVFCEIQRTWRQPDTEQYAELYAAYAPNCRAVMESYKRAQEVAGQPKK